MVTTIALLLAGAAAALLVESAFCHRAEVVRDLKNLGRSILDALFPPMMPVSPGDRELGWALRQFREQRLLEKGY